MNALAPHRRRYSGSVTADHSFEIQVKLSGTFTPGYAQTYMEPGQADSIDDIDIEEIGGLVYVPPTAPGLRSTWRPVDLLKGVDRNSPAYGQFVENLLAFLGDDAAEALLEEAPE